jgi:hypothetical protein
LPKKSTKSMRKRSRNTRISVIILIKGSLIRRLRGSLSSSILSRRTSQRQQIRC